MNLRKHLKKLIIGACLVLVGTVIIFPVEAHIVGGRDAHTLAGRHGIYFSPRAWVKKYFYTKRQANQRYYTKTQSNSRYYTKPSVDSLFGSYLTSSAASSTYLPLSGGTLAGTLNGTTFSGNNFQYQSAQTKYLMVSGADIRPLGDVQLTSSSYGGVYKSAGATNGTIAPINLPDGAVINSVKLYYYDTDATYQVGSYLMRTDYDTAFEDAVAYIASTGSGGLGTSSTTVASGKETIDNSQYYYYFKPYYQVGGSGSGLVIRGIRIEYTISSL